MGYHHLALAARDMAAVHHFYEDVMGFSKPPARIEKHRAGKDARRA